MNQTNGQVGWCIMNILNSIISWLDLQVGFSKKAQQSLAQERLGGQSASISYQCRGDDIISELKKGKPISSGSYYLFEDYGSLLRRECEIMKYDANTGVWDDAENSVTQRYTHYIHVSEYSSAMEKAFNNAKLRINNKTEIL